MSVFGFRDRVRRIVGTIDYRPDYRYDVDCDGGGVYVELLHWRPDALDGHMAWGRSGRRYLSEDITVSQIVRTLFGLALGYEEHEVREFFRYRGKQVFGPHIDVEALVEVADRVDFDAPAEWLTT